MTTLPDRTDWQYLEVEERGGRIVLTRPQTAWLQRNGLVAEADETYVPEVGFFALMPRCPSAPKAEAGRRQRINLTGVVK